MMKRVVIAALTVVGLVTFAASGLAQQYLSRTVTIIVPYAAGGPTDEVARVVANALSTKLKQNFIVENVSGGGTIIATNRVAHAAPDGYMLLLHNLQISANVMLYKNGSSGNRVDESNGKCGLKPHGYWVFEVS